MNIDQALQIADKVATFVENHHTPVIAAGAVLMAVLSGLGYLTRRKLRGKADLFGRFCDGAAVAVAVALSAEGMWEAATEKLHLDDWKAVLLFAFAELGMLRAARRARTKVGKGQAPGVYGHMVWGIAIVAAAVATSNAPNMTEHLIRVVAPLLVAWQWWADLIDALRENNPGFTRQRSSWIWTPRRLGVHLGLVQPGDGDDLDEVFRQRRINAMVRRARKVRSGGRLAGWHARRFEEMAERVDAATVAEVRERVQRGVRVQREVFGRQVVKVADRLTQPDDAGDAVVAHTGDAAVDAPGGAATADAVTQPDAPTVAQPDAGSDAPADAPAPPVTHLPLPALTRLVTQPDAVARRTREVVMKRPVSAPPADRDAALTQAVNAVLTQRISVRQAARDADVPEATLRRRVERIRSETQPTQKTNGHSFEPAGT